MKKSVISLGLVMALLAGVVLCSGFTEVQVTSDDSLKNSMYISNNKIVWDNYRNGDYNIYMCDLSLNGNAGGCLAGDSKTQVTSDSSDQSDPEISGDKIVWVDDNDDPRNADIYMCDLDLNGQSGGCLAGNAKIQVTSNLEQQMNSHISDDKIVWVDFRDSNYNIYMCDLSLNGNAGGCLAEDSKTQVTMAAPGESWPHISGNIIVWDDVRNVNWDIYMCDLSLNGQAGGCLANDIKSRVTGDSSDQLGNYISDNKIVWHDNRNVNWDIYMCDLDLNGQSGGCLAHDAKTRVTSDSSRQGYPQISDNKIVWGDDRNGDHDSSDIYMCDLYLNGNPGGCLASDIKTPVMIDNLNQQQYHFSDNKIVWKDIAYEADIFMIYLPGGECTPSCSGKECGSDGCGGSCGTCSSGICNSSGQCEVAQTPDCVSNCVGKECGDDGCGGSCGTCVTGQTCNIATGTCIVSSTGGCTSDSDCDDGVDCTEDICNVEGVCVYINNCEDLVVDVEEEDEGEGEVSNIIRGAENENQEQNNSIPSRDNNVLMIVIFIIAGVLILIGLGVVIYLAVKSSKNSEEGVEGGEMIS